MKYSNTITAISLALAGLSYIEVISIILTPVALLIAIVVNIMKYRVMRARTHNEELKSQILQEQLKKAKGNE